MAIDDQEKRQAVIGAGRPWMRNKFPVATPDGEWRASSGLTYGGNAFTSLVVVRHRSSERTVLVRFAAGDVLRRRVERTEGSDTLYTVADGSGIVIRGPLPEPGK